jgi:hypothetical protein
LCFQFSLLSIRLCKYPTNQHILQGQSVISSGKNRRIQIHHPVLCSYSHQFWEQGSRDPGKRRHPCDSWCARELATGTADFCLTLFFAAYFFPFLSSDEPRPRKNKLKLGGSLQGLAITGQFQTWRKSGSAALTFDLGSDSSRSSWSCFAHQPVSKESKSWRLNG